MQMKLLVLFFIVFSFQSFAEGFDSEQRTDFERIVLDFSVDENNDILPDVYFPYQWSDTKFAAVSYRSTFSSENGVVANTQSSDKLSQISYNILNVYPVIWVSKDSIMGIDMEILDINKQQAGYFVSTGQLYNFRNELNIQIIKPAFLYQFNKFENKNSGLSYGFSLSPFSQISVDQTTGFTGALNQTGSASGDVESGFSFRFNLDGRHKYSNGMQSYYDVRYEYLPLKYTLDVLHSNGLFVNEQFDVLEHILKATYKVKLNMKLYKKLKPVIGFSVETTSGENKNTGETYSFDRIAFVFGTEG